jgi:hypothetical protein
MTSRPSENAVNIGAVPTAVNCSRLCGASNASGLDARWSPDVHPATNSSIGTERTIDAVFDVRLDVLFDVPFETREYRAMGAMVNAPR